MWISYPGFTETGADDDDHGDDNDDHDHGDDDADDDADDDNDNDNDVTYRIVDQLSRLHRDWSGEKLYQVNTFLKNTDFFLEWISQIGFLRLDWI